MGAAEVSQAAGRLCAGATTSSAINNSFWTLGLALTDHFTQLAEIVVVSRKQLPTTLSDFVYERVRVLLALLVHKPYSNHSISGVTICGVNRPSRRLITVRWASLFGFAK